MANVLHTISTRATPQTKPAGGATVKNAAGGYTFQVSDVARLRRFLVLGTEGGTYYMRDTKLTEENAAVVMRMAETDPITLVDTIVEISVAGRAPKQDQAIFALALAASVGTPEGKAYAMSKVNEVCRTGTHLYNFGTFVQQFRGWGRGLKRAIGNWYLAKPLDKETYQLLKYRQRDGWMHRDLLRKSHPTPDSQARRALHDYLMTKTMGNHTASARATEKFGEAATSPYAGRTIDYAKLPALVTAYEAVQDATVAKAVKWIADFDLSWEMLPDRLHNEPEIWEALLNKERPLPQTALIRQLPRLTNLGLTRGETGALITRLLTDEQRMKWGRVHPFKVLVAARTYASGRSVKGDTTWSPTSGIVDALNDGFYAAYGGVTPAGVPTLLALDVSGSMSNPAAGSPLNCREVSAAMSLVTLATESNARVIGFSDGSTTGGKRFTGNTVATELDISPRRRLDDVISYIEKLPFGRTDCSLPLIWAERNGLDFHAVTTYTDNETYFGQIHPWQALKRYREFVGHDVKYTVVSVSATGNSICDPADPSSLDVAGFDQNVPQILADFAGGRI